MSSEPSTSNSTDDKNDDEPDRSFECNICLDTAKEAVVSLCGHLYCWACLYTWLDTNPHNKVCPVCKAAISKEKVVPIYGRGKTTEDPREKVPPRPAGTRTEPENNASGSGYNVPPVGNFHMSFGIGPMPFAVWSRNGFGAGWGRGHVAHGMHTNNEPESNVPQVLLLIALLYILFFL